MSHFPSPGTSIVDDRQGRDTAIHKNLQGSVDRGSLGHDSQVTEGANAQFLHCFLQEAWLGNGRTLQWTGQGWAGTYTHLDTLVCAPIHQPCVCTRSPNTHKDVEKFEDALVRQDVQDIARDGLNDRQAVDFVLDQGVDSVEEAVGDADIAGGSGCAPGTHTPAPRGVLSPSGQALTYCSERWRPVA